MEEIQPPGTGNAICGPVEKAVLAGVVHGGVHVYAGAAEVSLPCRFGSVPPLADGFQRREMPAESGCVVLTGTGGVGKTQMAADFTGRAWADGAVRASAWVSAGSRDEVVTAYAGWARQLRGGVPDDPDGAVAWLLSWLGSTTEPWLVVLDDVADPRDLHGLWPPESANGQVVVTTRRQDSALRAARRRVVPVGLFTSEQSRACLGEHLRDPDLMVGADDLIRELGDLPLAVAHAGAYLADRNLSCERYLARWHDRDRTLPSLFPPDAELPEGQARTVAVTWSLSVDRADRLEPAGLARPLLHIAALLDPNGIPVRILTAPPVLAYLDTTTENAWDALTCLNRLSLITLHATTVRVHALVQRATREQATAADLAARSKVAADALLSVWPDPEPDAALSAALRANTAALDAAAGPHLWANGGYPTLFHAAQSLHEAGQVTAAREYYSALRTASVHHYGPDHPRTLHARINAAASRGESGDVLGASTECVELLADCVRLLGSDNLLTLVTRNHLATWRGRGGDPAGAVAEFEGLLADCLRVFGPEHRSTLYVRNNLASWRSHCGDRTGARAEFESLLADRLRVLGVDHPDTMVTRNNMATLRAEAGDIAGALTEFEGLLADYLRILGPKHPKTLLVQANIATWRGYTGEAGAALAAFETGLAEQTRVLGPTHPDTLRSRANIAYWTARTGNTADSIAKYEALLADRARILGPNHPETRYTRFNLDYVRNLVGEGGAREDESPPGPDHITGR
ncbi:tetratricopeptide repeat protein [Actinokineospora auranticolor]|uniref:tetratricopeptide repeat protein n=1 Tax=Actinokineospora auranticolor TaxID=155976 RepID=UPI0015E3C2A3|nr:tetratricopeptide repeat protein [Actinokineospora auranticolor]